MMGGHHAAMGAAGWVALTSGAAYALHIYPCSPLGVAAGALVCAGAALLPDADHHNATIANSLPPISEVICRGIGKISGGHRHGTHSLLGVLTFGVLAWLIGLVHLTVPGLGSVAIGAGVAGLVLVAFAAQALKLTRGGWLGSWTLGLIVASFVTAAAPTEWYWLPSAVGLGCSIHLIGDALTTGGVPFLWPWTPKPPKWFRKVPVLKQCWRRNGFVAAPILGNAGGVREVILLIPISLYALIGVTEAMVTGVAGAPPGWMTDVVQRLTEGRG